MSPLTRPQRPPGRLERSLGLTFHDKDVLEQALTHRSYVHEHPGEDGQTNERLEFLGDAIFQFVVADLLYTRFPEQPEGRLTTLRAALVNTDSFAAVGEQLDLAPHVRVSRGEATLDGRGRQSILAGCVEAIVAAAYIDSGLDEARALVERLIVPRIARAAQEEAVANVKGRLQEIVQAERGITPRYRVVSRSGPVHAERFEVEVVAGEDVLGHGAGTGKREAEHNSAREALAILLSGAVGTLRGDPLPLTPSLPVGEGLGERASAPHVIAPTMTTDPPEAIGRAPAGAAAGD